MRFILAPWREPYIKNVFKKKNECIFCRALQMKNDKKAFIIFRGAHNFIILNKYPYTPGHLMIAPFRHLPSPENEDTASLHELMDLFQLSLNVLRTHYEPQGFNTGMNLGQSAGAGVTDHYHLHVLPRWTGDANFLPIVGKTKVVIEDLPTTYEKLHPLFQECRSSKKDQKEIKVSSC
ncbi:MAG: HIT domain-containing protein [Candidatus Aminicenantes bacterium]|nr:HIT domain-containing protein [Candidatus Aminicenantes bacterium]